MICSCMNFYLAEQQLKLNKQCYFKLKGHANKLN